MILDGSENSWMVMSTTPQIFLDGNEHYHPRIFTTFKIREHSIVSPLLQTNIARNYLLSLKELVSSLI